MIITPRIFIVAVVTGLYWLFALTTALFLVAGTIRSHMPFLYVGVGGAVICLIIRLGYARNREKLQRWVRN